MRRPEHRCTGDTCALCNAAIALAEDGDWEVESGDFDPDYHYPRDLAPSGP